MQLNLDRNNKAIPKSKTTPLINTKARGYRGPSPRTMSLGETLSYEYKCVSSLLSLDTKSETETERGSEWGLNLFPGG